MSDLQDALARIKARAETAEPYAEQIDAGYPPHSESMVLQSQADVPRLVEAIEAVLEINTGDNRSIYGIDFEVGMVKALHLVHRALTDKLTGEDDE